MQWCGLGNSTISTLLHSATAQVSPGWVFVFDGWSQRMYWSGRRNLRLQVRCIVSVSPIDKACSSTADNQHRCDGVGWEDQPPFNQGNQNSILSLWIFEWTLGYLTEFPILYRLHCTHTSMLRRRQMYQQWDSCGRFNHARCLFPCQLFL